MSKKHMLNEQQEQLIDFIGNLVALMHRDGHSRECAYAAVRGAVACLFGVIWDVKPDGRDADAIAEFVSTVIEAALTKFYGTATVELQA